jgi:hypothetical protein
MDCSAGAYQDLNKGEPPIPSYCIIFVHVWVLYGLNDQMSLSRSLTVLSSGRWDAEDRGTHHISGYLRANFVLQLSLGLNGAGTSNFHALLSSISASLGRRWGEETLNL